MKLAQWHKPFCPTKLPDKINSPRISGACCKNNFLQKSGLNDMQLMIRSVSSCHHGSAVNACAQYYDEVIIGFIVTGKPMFSNMESLCGPRAILILFSVRYSSYRDLTRVYWLLMYKYTTLVHEAWTLTQTENPQHWLDHNCYKINMILIITCTEWTKSFGQLIILMVQ